GYNEYLRQNPGDADAQSGLAQVKLIRRIGSQDLDAAISRAQANPNDISAALLAADARVISGDAQTAYDDLIALVGRTSGQDRDTVRKHLLELFSVAATDDPLVAKARRKLATVLF